MFLADAATGSKDSDTWVTAVLQCSLSPTKWKKCGATPGRQVFLLFSTKPQDMDSLQTHSVEFDLHKQILKSVLEIGSDTVRVLPRHLFLLFSPADNWPGPQFFLHVK